MKGCQIILLIDDQTLKVWDAKNILLDTFHPYELKQSKGCHDYGLNSDSPISIYREWDPIREQEDDAGDDPGGIGNDIKHACAGINRSASHSS